MALFHFVQALVDATTGRRPTRHQKLLFKKRSDIVRQLLDAATTGTAAGRPSSNKIYLILLCSLGKRIISTRLKFA